MPDVPVHVAMLAAYDELQQSTGQDQMNKKKKNKNSNNKDEVEEEEKRRI